MRADPRRDQRGRSRASTPGSQQTEPRTRQLADAAAVGRGALPAGPVVARGGAPHPPLPAPIRRAVLSRDGRHGGQHAVARKRRGAKAADALPVGLQRDGHIDEAAIHDHHRVRLEHGRDQMAGAERRRSGNRAAQQRPYLASRAKRRAGACPAASTTPAASARATAWS